jgi:hypothetical protein
MSITWARVMKVCVRAPVFIVAIVAANGLALTPSISAEMKCKVLISYLIAKDKQVALPERAGYTFLYIINLPSQLIIQPVEPSGTPLEFNCSQEKSLACRRSKHQINLSIVPNYPVNAVSDEYAEKFDGKVRDILTCRFLKQGETALSPD